MFVVGLSGGVGSGKSTVAGILASHGMYLIDADVVAREVVEPKSPGLAAITEHFGQAILTAEGALDRDLMAEIVFGDPEKLEALNGIVHPLVRQSIESQLTALIDTDKLVLLTVPLMVESQQYSYDVLVVVDIPEDIAVKRIMAQRGWSESQARSRIAAQASRQERLNAADFVIDNSGTQKELKERVEDLWVWIQAHLAP